MNKLITVALSALFATGVALAQAPAAPAKAAPAAAAPAKAAEPAKPAEAATVAKPAAAASDCEAKAVSKSGKPLHGAAKAASIKKCEGAGGTAAAAKPAVKPAAEAAKPAAAMASGCAEKAVGKNGKPLAGAAKTTFMKKCEADAKAAK